ncbi:MAG: geranylgeranyl reductase family protein [Bacteroidales bacterium]|nr:geranylgeranyl reductase family protein [Bacteroidales bacterium]
MLYDIIVTGAGPAGSFAAYNLAKKGYKTLLIDKAIFPRYKTCGGGITYKTFNLIPFNLDSITQSSIYNFIFSSKFDNIYRRQSDKLLMKCFMRDEFDNMLALEAISAGAVFLQQEKIKNIETHPDFFLINTEKNSFKSKILIGADGANSTVARCLNLMQNAVFKAYAIESEVYTNDNILKQYENTVGLDWGTIIDGYGWIFPKKEHLSIGVGASLKNAKLVKPYYDALCNKLKINTQSVKSFKAHPIPFRINNNPIYSGKAILIGDAAGLTDPLTGEGIYYAMKSAIIAADTIASFLSDNRQQSVDASPNRDLAQYQNEINKQIMPELLAAIPVQHIYNCAPLYFHKLIGKNERLWSAFCRILRGDLNYFDIQKKFPYSSILWKPLTKTAKLVHNYKNNSTPPTFI